MNYKERYNELWNKEDNEELTIEKMEKLFNTLKDEQEEYMQLTNRNMAITGLITVFNFIMVLYMLLLKIE